MSKIKLFLVFALVVATTGFIAQPAQAAQITKVRLEVPKYLGVGQPNLIDVPFCEISSPTSSVCLDASAKRTFRLFANGTQVEKVSAKSATSFSWTPKHTGSYTLQVVVDKSSKAAAGRSEPTKVKVVSGLTKSPLKAVSCDISCSGFPTSVSIDDADTPTYVYALVGSSAKVKNNVAHLQYLNSKNIWADDASGKVAWLSEFSQYGVRLKFNFAWQTFCNPDDGPYDYSYRISTESNSKYVAQSTTPVWVEASCSVSWGLTTDATDQDIDTSLGDIVDPVTVDVTAPVDSTYTVQLVYCSGTTCDLDPSSWYVADSIDGFGSDSFTMDASIGYQLGDWTYTVVVLPDDGTANLVDDYYYLYIY